MILAKKSQYLVLLLAFVTVPSSAQKSLYTPCPLLGPWVPAPTIDVSDPIINLGRAQIDQVFSQYVAAGDGKYGPISTNTTSFSIALFAAGNESVLGPDKPFFYEFHHAAPFSNGSTSSLNANTPFPIADLTQLFTVYAQLVTLGESSWSCPVTDYLPQLQAQGKSQIQQVQWEDVTLGSLAGHMAGIERDSYECHIDQRCNTARFIKALIQSTPVELPDTTPIYSRTAFQVIATALEARLHDPYDVVLQNRLLRPLDLAHSTLLSPKADIYGHGLDNGSIVGEPASLGLVSTIADLSRFGRSILNNNLLSPATTRRWLKPFTSTSNLRNAVGRPWEVYHYSNQSIDPIIDIYTKSGSVGRYSSYFGLAPDFNLGFAILAVDSVTPTPDLNAYADLVLDALFPIQKLGLLQANSSLSGPYRASGSSSASYLTVGSVSRLPGLPLKELVINGTDWRANIARQSGINPSDVDIRLYPTNLQDSRGNGTERAFRAVIQDQSALVDAGTPTCISWQTVDVLRREGKPLDEFVFTLDAKGKAIAVSLPALGVTLRRG